MHDARGGNDLVRRIAGEVQAGRGTCDGEVDRPNMQTTQDAHHFPVVQVHTQPTELNELRQLPQHNRRYGLATVGQQVPLRGLKVSGERKDEDVRIKVEHRHPSAGRSSTGRP